MARIIMHPVAVHRAPHVELRTPPFRDPRERVTATPQGGVGVRHAFTILGRRVRAGVKGEL